MTRLDLARRLAGLQVAYHLGELPRWRYTVLRRGPALAYRLERPVRRSARRQVQTAVEAGQLARPCACEDCGRFGPVEGHQPNYDRPLEVVWLCERCHAVADRVLAGARQ